MNILLIYYLKNSFRKNINRVIRAATEKYRKNQNNYGAKYLFIICEGDSVDAVATTLALTYGYITYKILAEDIRTRANQLFGLTEVVPVFNLPIDEMTKQKDVVNYLYLHNLEHKHFVHK